MLQHRLGISERAACRVTHQPRSTQRRTPRADTPEDPDSWLRDWLNTFAQQPRNQRKGYRRAYADLRAAGHVINRKKVHRIWRQEGLQVARRTRRKRVGTNTCGITDADAADVVWAMDFQFDATADHQRIKIASMVDEHTRESLLSIVHRSITAETLITEIAVLINTRGKPMVLRCDNGPEFVSKALADFCENIIGIVYIPPGEPWRNGYIESFNNRLRDECLNLNQFHSLLHARVIINDWKHDYNQYHRHSSLEYQTPNEYAQACSHTHQTPKPTGT